LKFIPRRPREGINVSDTHPLIEAGTLFVGLTLIFAGIAVVLVFMIEIVLFFIPVEKEAALFRNWLPGDIETVSPVDERLYQTQLLVDRLVRHWPDVPYEVRVEIDKSEVANAMAFPGGLIVVTQGLLDDVESENELAFVLGHELGHFRNRDHLRALGRGIAFSLFYAVVMGNDAAGLGLRVSDLAVRGFSRKQESSADAFGLAIVNAEYGHVDEAWRLFERWDKGADSSIDVISYLSTHPRAGDRVAKLRDLAHQEGWQLEGPVTPLPW